MTGLGSRIHRIPVTHEAVLTSRQVVQILLAEREVYQQGSAQAVMITIGWIGGGAKTSLRFDVEVSLTPGSAARADGAVVIEGLNK